MIIEGCHPKALPVQQLCLTVLLQMRRCRRLTLPSSRASLNSMARNWLIKGEANTLLGYLVPLA